MRRAISDAASKPIAIPERASLSPYAIIIPGCAGLRSQEHAKANFVCALSYRIRDYSIHTHDCQGISTIATSYTRIIEVDLWIILQKTGKLIRSLDLK